MHEQNRRTFIKNFGLLASGIAAVPMHSHAAGQLRPAWSFDPTQNPIPAPSDQNARQTFREQLTAWRKKERHALNHSDAQYRRPEFRWIAKGFGWYMDGGQRPNSFAAKMLLMWPGLDRCATVGFRCVAEG